MWGLAVAVALCAIAFGVLVLMLLLPPTEVRSPLAVIDLDRRTVQVVGRAPLSDGGLVAPSSTPDARRPMPDAPAPPPPTIERPVVEPDREVVEPPVQPASLPAATPPPVASGEPPWRRYAVPVAVRRDQAMIAIVIDDLGLSPARTQAAIALRPPLTLSFLPYGNDLEGLTRSARAAGHELLVHVSMQPSDPAIDPGPHALTVDLDAPEILRRLRWALDRFDGYVGINNHMGSRFTADARGMDVVLAELHSRGLLFLDSFTSSGSVGFERARSQRVPAAVRHVFLDNDRSASAIEGALQEVERVAESGGLAIAIGHPYPETLAALEAWLPTLQDAGFVQVPLSAAVIRRSRAANDDRI